MPIRHMVVAGTLLLLAAVPGAQAATFTVTKTADTRDGSCNADCSLREAIDAANAAPDADEIVLPGGSYQLTISGTNEDLNANGDLDILGDVALRGAGAATTQIRQWGEERVLDVHGSATDLAITGLTVTGGFAKFAAGGGINSPDGGNLSLSATVLSGNRASNASAGAGGGLRFYKGALTITASAIVDNRADYGGGIALDWPQTTATITNTTLTGNSALSNNGGAIQINSALTATLSFTTLVANTSALDGGGIAGDVSKTTMRGSIIAANRSGAALTNCDSGEGPISGGGNITDGGCNMLAPADTVASPVLAPLTFAQAIPGMMPQPGSLAIGRVASDCPATDATGTTRPVPCTSGAIEPPAAAAVPPAPEPIVNTVRVEVPVATPAPPRIATPKLSGTARVGKTLRCRVSGVKGAGYRWLRDGKTIKKATKPSYKLTGKDRRKVLTCVVSARNASGVTSTLSPGRYVR